MGRVKAPAAAVASLTHAEVSRYADMWLADCDARRHSPQTSALRRTIVNNLLWFMQSRKIPACGRMEVTAFLSYLKSGHTDPGGRWGNPQMTRPVRPATSAAYYGHLRTFFRWVVTEGGLTTSPMEVMRAPENNSDQIQPFTEGQIEAMLSACRRSWEPARDMAMVWLLLDTGIRASELTGLRVRDLDMTEKRIRVLGKGSKERSVYFGKRCTKALWDYLRSVETEPEEFLFCAGRGVYVGEHLTADGLGNVIERLGQRAGLEGVRCSPHTFRHTFAVSFLRGGGAEFALMEILGHTSLSMTRRYVRFAQADISSQRRFSPGDQMKPAGALVRALGTRAEARQGQVKQGQIKADAPPKPRKPEPKVPPRAHGQPKVTPDQVRHIRQALGVHPAKTAASRRAAIAQQFGLTPRAVKDIDLRVTWSWLE